MAILINTGGLVTNGTNGADEIIFQSGLTGNGSVVNGLDGNDTIIGSGFAVISAGAVGAAPNIVAGGGADSIDITFSGATESASNLLINGGAGGDTIVVSGNSGSIAKIAGGDGADSIVLGGSGTLESLGAGNGGDTITFNSGTVTLATGGTLGLGAGADLLDSSGGVFTAKSGASIFGGGGADTIILEDLSTATTLNLDTNEDGGFADLAVIYTADDESTIRGKGGADTIIIGDLDNNSVVNGNAGGDTLVFLTGVDSSTLIAGGQGGDNIILSDQVANNFLTGVDAQISSQSANFNADGEAFSVYGGGGNDTISIDAQNISGVSINGGAGSDLISFNSGIDEVGAGTSAGEFGVIEISDLSDSKIGGMDTIIVTTGNIGSGTLDVAASTALDLGSSAAAISGVDNATGQAFSSVAGLTGSVSGGAMSFDAQASADVVEAAKIADAITLGINRGDVGTPDTTAGRSLTFTAGDNTYLFVQGGAAGTDDDYVVMFDGDGAVAAASGIIGNTITLE